MQLGSLNDVLMEELADLYSAENQLVEALPEVAQSANNAELKAALREHLDETRNHVTRLDQVFQSMGETSRDEHCDGMEGLISEGKEVLEASGDPDAKDAAIIAAAQRVEHYEIAAYGSARTMAEQLGLDDAARLLEETLQEEGEADKKLTTIATGKLLSKGINREAQS